MRWLERIPAPRLKPFTMPRRELIVRAALNVAIVAAIAAGLSPWFATPLFLVGVAATAELAVRNYSANGVEKALLICGATVTAFILVGLFLNFTPLGLTRASWGASWLVISTGVLVWRRDSATPIRRDDIKSYILRHWVIGLYGIAALAIFVGAVYLAMAGVWSSNQRPMLAFSLVSKSASQVVVKINATSTTGTYRIVAQSGNRPPHYSSSPISVNADGNGETLVENVPVNVPGRWTIHLNSVNGSNSSRELIINVG
jgi:hypothetical protein